MYEQKFHKSFFPDTNVLCHIRFFTPKKYFQKIFLRVKFSKKYTSGNQNSKGGENVTLQMCRILFTYKYFTKEVYHINIIFFSSNQTSPPQFHDINSVVVFMIGGKIKKFIFSILDNGNEYLLPILFFCFEEQPISK